MTVASVGVAAGSGRLIRRTTAVLYDVSGENRDLASRFKAAASDAAALAEVKRHLIDVEFQVSPLVVLAWTEDGFDLVLFGDVEVHSSSIAASMVSGAGSATWIERHLGDVELAGATRAEVWSGKPADDSTDLQRGTVAAAGFHITLDFAGVPLPDPRASEALPVEPEAPEPEAPEPEPEAFSSEALPGEPAASPEPAAQNFVDDPPTQPDPLPAPAPEAPDDPFAPLPAPTPGLVEAAICEHGHPNPPGSRTCLVCRSDLAADASLRLIEQPRVGQLVFGDGQAVPIDSRIILGRKPEADADHTLEVVIDHVEVSRSHARVSIDGWAVLLTDLGSRNGTYVTSPGSGAPTRLEPGVQHLLEHGTVVHLGGPDTSFIYETLDD